MISLHNLKEAMQLDHSKGTTVFQFAPVMISTH